MSTTFVDGPAHGVRLELRRAPIMLRVARDLGGNVPGRWRALSALEDHPERDEALCVYALVGAPDWQPRGTANKYGRYMHQTAIATYRHFPDAPHDEILRDNRLWAEWCTSNRERLTPDWARAVPA